MEGKERNVGEIMLRTDRPTELTFSDLYKWIIWQFPRRKGTGLCGAVHPPLANHTWYPAVIKFREKRVLVHGHIDKEFASPNAAAEWLETNGLP